MTPLRQLTKVLCIAGFATLAATSATAAPDDDQFVVAMQIYNDCHYPIAYARLSGLADSGHAEAARIALLMVRYGPQLYGSEWSASPRQIDNWIRLASIEQSYFVAAGGD